MFNSLLIYINFIENKSVGILSRKHVEFVAVWLSNGGASVFINDFREFLQSVGLNRYIDHHCNHFITNIQNQQFHICLK